MEDIELFKNMSKADISELLKFLNAREVTFKKDMTILSNLNNARDVGILLDGLVSLVRTDYNGNRTIVQNFKKGEIFGGRFTDYTNEELFIMASEESKILFIDFDLIFKERRNTKFSKLFSNNLINMLIDKINNDNLRIEVLTKKTIREKLLEYFHNLEKESGSSTIKLPFSFTMLADYLAIDRSAMSRELKNLKDDGIIKTNGRQITLIYR